MQTHSQLAPFRTDRNVRIFNALTFAREFTPILAVWVVYLTDYRGLTLAQVGLMEGLFWLVKLLAEIPSGAFADRFGRRAAMTAAAILECGGLLLFGFADNFTILAVSYIIWGSGFAFRSGAAEAYLYDALQANNREREYTDRLGVFWALDLGGAFVGGIVGGVIAVIWGLQAAVLATTFSYIVMLPLLWLLEEPPRKPRSAEDEAAARRRSYLATLREGFATVGRNKPVRAMIVLQIALMSGFAGYALLAQPFLSHYEVPLGLFGVLTAPVMLISAGAGLISGRLVRALGLATVMVLAITGAVGGLVLLAAVDHVAAFAGFGITAAGLGIVAPAAGAYVNDRTESAVRATVLSVAPFGESITVGITNTATGVLGDSSLRLAFAVLAAVIFTAATAAFLAWRAAERTAPPLATTTEA